MARHGMAMTLVALLCAAGAASARPLRLLQGADGGINVQYVPQGAGCDGLTVKVNGAESNSRWFSSGPSIRGQVLLLNPRQYDIPVDSIQVQAQSSDGQFYTGRAWCDSGRGTVVPSNPQPYTLGSATCSYTIDLDQQVFSSYSQALSSASASSGSGGSGFGSSGFGSSFGGGGSSSSSSSQAQSSGVSYIPSGWNRPTWTVTAVATISLSNAQCSSSPVTVDTSSWWSWFSGGWWSRHRGW